MDREGYEREVMIQHWEEKIEDYLTSYIGLMLEKLSDENAEFQRQLEKQEPVQTKFSLKGHEVEFKHNLTVLDGLEALQSLITISTPSRLSKTTKRGVKEVL